MLVLVLYFVMTQRRRNKKLQRNKSSPEQIILSKKHGQAEVNIDETTEESEAVFVTPQHPNMDGSMIVNSESTTYVPRSDSTLVTRKLEMTQTQQSSQMDPSQASIIQQIVNEPHFTGI